MNYQELYFKLFASIEDALLALEKGDHPTAFQVLLQAVNLGEEAHLNTSRPSEPQLPQ